MLFFHDLVYGGTPCVCEREQGDQSSELQSIVYCNLYGLLVYLSGNLPPLFM